MPSYAIDALHKKQRITYHSLMPSPNRSVKKSAKSFQDLPPIRVRREPPTLDEAVAAARDLADELEHQVEIAAGLIGLPADEVRPHVEAARARSGRMAGQMSGRPEARFEHRQERIVNAGSPNRPPRTVVVERRSRPIVVERRGRSFEPRR